MAFPINCYYPSLFYEQFSVPDIDGNRSIDYDQVANLPHVEMAKCFDLLGNNKYSNTGGTRWLF